jgi:hypothetical protein
MEYIPRALKFSWTTHLALLVRTIKVGDHQTPRPRTQEPFFNITWQQPAQPKPQPQPKRVSTLEHLETGMKNGSIQVFRKSVDFYYNTSTSITFCTVLYSEHDDDYLYSVLQYEHQCHGKTHGVQEGCLLSQLTALHSNEDPQVSPYITAIISSTRK